MIEIAKLISGAKVNRMATPVDPVKRTVESGGDQRRNTDSGAIANRVQAETVASNVPNRSQIQSAVERSNSQLEAYNTSLKFRVNEEAEKVVVSLIENDTGEVIRQFPPDELLTLSARLKDLVSEINEDGQRRIVGFLVDHRQ